MRGWAWLRSLIGPDPELVEERDALAAQVDALAVERDELTEQVRQVIEASDQRARDLRAARRAAVAEAFEPDPPGITETFVRPQDGETYRVLWVKGQEDEA